MNPGKRSPEWVDGSRMPAWWSARRLAADANGGLLLGDSVRRLDFRFYAGFCRFRGEAVLMPGGEYMPVHECWCNGGRRLIGPRDATVCDRYGSDMAAAWRESFEEGGGK